MANVKELLINGVDILDIIYPVGSIYETMDSSFSPSESFGGTWERIKGKVLVGVDESDSTFKSSKLTGGEKSHTLTINEMPSHNHTIGRSDGSNLTSWSTNAGAGNDWYIACDGGTPGKQNYYIAKDKGGGRIPQQPSTLYHVLYLAKNSIRDLVNSLSVWKEVYCNG